MVAASGMLFMLACFMLAPVAVYALTKARTIGKMGCFFLEKDKSITFKLYKVEGPYVQVEDEKYGVSPSRIRFMGFPLGWPKLFQQVIPCSMYQREDFQPLDLNEPTDWVNLVGSKDSAVEMSAILEPRWLAQIVRGTREGASIEDNRVKKWLPAVTLGIVVAILVFMFYLITKLNGMGAEIGHLEDLVKGM